MQRKRALDALHVTDTGSVAADAAKAHGVELTVVKLPEARRGFVLLPKPWIVERSFA